ncbi:hypothetical protein AOLI_G00001880 [Acnodon oligacanthus]
MYNVATCGGFALSVDLMVVVRSTMRRTTWQTLEDGLKYRATEGQQKGQQPGEGRKEEGRAVEEQQRREVDRQQATAEIDPLSLPSPASVDMSVLTDESRARRGFSFGWKLTI